MSNSDDARLKQEIDKISEDVKRIMRKVEAFYPRKKPANNPDDGQDQGAGDESDESATDEDGAPGG